MIAWSCIVFSKPKKGVKVTSFYVLQALCSAGVETLRTIFKMCCLEEGKVDRGNNSTAIVDVTA